jgi:hypothetical protein
MRGQLAGLSRPARLSLRMFLRHSGALRALGTELLAVPEQRCTTRALSDGALG